MNQQAFLISAGIIGVLWIGFNRGKPSREGHNLLDQSKPEAVTAMNERRLAGEEKKR